MKKVKKGSQEGLSSGIIDLSGFSVPNEWMCCC
jgi:hypothetical protein